MTQIGSSTPTYDLDGNVLTDTAHTYTWDVNGRPLSLDGVGITYDALGRMVEQNRSGAYTQIVYSPTGAKILIMNGTTFVKSFVAQTGGSTAVYNPSGLAYYRHSDWLGSSRFASTPARALYFDGAYAPFGENYAQTGTTDLSFTGMNQDTVSNLFDFPAREYNGIHGRWPSPDPAGVSAVRRSDPQTMNRYAYVRNSPLRLTDPSGMDPCDGSDGSGNDDGGVQSAGLRRKHHASDEPLNQAPAGGPGGGPGGGGGGCGSSINDPLVDDGSLIDGWLFLPDGEIWATNDLPALTADVFGMSEDDLAILYNGPGSDYLPPTALSTLPLLSNMDTNIGQVIGIVAGGDALVAGGVVVAPAVGAVVDTLGSVGMAIGTDPGAVGAATEVFSGMGTAYTATPLGALAGAIGACMSIDGCMDPLQ